MSIFSTSAEFATIIEGLDLFEISDGRLKFKDGKSGIITAKFMVTHNIAWKKIRLTFRRLGKNLRTENYVIARLIKIRRTTLVSETLTFANSQNIVSDSHEIISTIGFSTLSGSPDFNNFFYHIEIVMRRSPLLVFPEQVVTEAISISEVFTLNQKTQNEIECKEPNEAKISKTHSIPIPPPTNAEISTIKYLRESSALIQFHPRAGVLTPSPEFILAQLSTSSQGFG